MGTNMLKNLAGLKLSEKEMNDIPYPRFEMTFHVTTKTIQAGAFIGMLVAAPIASAISGSLNLTDVKDRSLRYGLNGCLVGAALGPPLTLLALKNASYDSIVDRCYRIRYNRNQVRVDRASLLGAGIGAAAAKGLCDKGKCSLSEREGALTGMMGGMLSAFVFNLIHGDKHS